MVNESVGSPIGVSRGECQQKLGPMLKDGRDKKGISQDALAMKLNVKASTISNFEKGVRLPSLVQLATLSRALDLDIQTLVLCRTFDEVCLDKPLATAPENMHRQECLLRQLENRIQDAKIEVASVPSSWFKGRTFLDFPHAFPNIKIITGDRRDTPPKTVGDIGAYSASPIDDRWIYDLRLPRGTEKVSDKEFVLSTEDKLYQKYGEANLLVIGSPAANHLARLVNEGAIFRFNIQKGYKEALDDVLKDRLVDKSGESIPRKKEEHLKDLKRMMLQFFGFGIVDPVATNSLRGFVLPGGVDYGTITFASNPFYKGDDFRYVAILVAGFHHPGTIWALKCLGSPENEKTGFREHPYGGVVRIDIDTEKLWEERMCEAKCSWDTNPYKKEDLLKGLDELKNLGSSLMQVNPAEVEQCKKLVTSL